jgi:hypothetical protein
VILLNAETENEMHTSVVIETWKKCDKYTHAHLNASDDISSSDGYAIEVDTDTFLRVALISGRVKEGPDGHKLVNTNCQELCNLVSGVLDYSDRQIATARGQLEGCGADVSMLEPLEIAYLDYEARELWAEEARTATDPWHCKLELKCDVVYHLLTEYTARAANSDAPGE